MLPDEFRGEFEPILNVQDDEEQKLIKYADRICAYFKCVEESNAGNKEFADAKESIKADIDAIDAPEVKYFMDKFAGGFDLTLDKLR